MQRNAVAASFAGDYGDFLRSCEIKLTVFNLVHATNEEYGRCYELIQRTNQLTLAGRRYSESAFRDLVIQDGMQAFEIRCTDRFGDYGIVGAVLFRLHGQEVCIEEFVMSCRVAKKRCETAIVSRIVGKARESGASIVVADLVKTGRNGALISAFSEIDGMVPKETRIRYEKILGDNAEVTQVVTVIES